MVLAVSFWDRGFRSFGLSVYLQYGNYSTLCVPLTIIALISQIFAYGLQYISTGVG